jgi:putative ABC transport system permease protein
MAIPLSYNLRNLVVRKTTTIMTALGIALTVAVLMAVMALMDGLKATLAASGDPLRVMVLRKGSTSELASILLRTQIGDIKFKPGIAPGRNGQPLASFEVLSVTNIANVDNPNGVNLTVRGVPREGIELRRGTRIISGRWFEQGHKEVVVGSSVAKRFPQGRVGGKIPFGRSEWEVVGIMDSGRGAQDSEVWGDVNQVSADLNRIESLSSALLLATDAVAAKALVNDISNDQRLTMEAMPEKEYYERDTASAVPIQYTGFFIAIIMAVGSSFAAMNTMYAAVSRRAREIGTLRVLGFSRISILLSFFIESVLLAGLGGVLGCLLVWPLLNGRTTGVGNRNFSELAFDFRVSPRIMLYGVLFAVVLGVFGGLFPARNASRKQILNALREI